MNKYYRNISVIVVIVVIFMGSFSHLSGVNLFGQTKYLNKTSCLFRWNPSRRAGPARPYVNG